MSCSPICRSGAGHPQSLATPQDQAGPYRPGVGLSADLSNLLFSLLITAAIAAKLSSINWLKQCHEPEHCLHQLPISPCPSSSCNGKLDSL